VAVSRRGHSPGRSGRQGGIPTLPTGIAAAFLAVALAFLASTVEPADGAPLRRPLLPQDRLLFDLIVRNVEDADLLTARQAVLREHWRRLGVRPGGATPSLATLFLARSAERNEWDPFDAERTRTEWIYDFDQEIAARVEIPERALFSAVVDTNAVGVAFRSQRDFSRSDLDVDVDRFDAHLRVAASRALQDQWSEQVRNRAAAGESQGELLNFTLPLNIPRTIERIIGKGEATSIRISGTERIRIGGQSTVRDDFIGNEIQQSQSLFPQLELEQSLRVNLDGQVGEKIKVRVSHDSQRVGSESTEIRLSFEGDEDDIIQTIRAGNIDVTLPGSGLLGVGASRGGLFGLKLTGAVGPVDYTVLTSKEEATQESRTFSQSGGSREEEEIVISDVDYSRGRFFRLTAPFPLYFPDRPDFPLDGSGADLQQFGIPDARWRIDPESIDVYTLARSGASDENTVDHGIAVLDDSGLGWEGFGAGTGVGPPGLDPQATDEELAAYVIETYGRTGRLQTGTRWRRLVRGDAGDLGGRGDWFPLTQLGTEQVIGIEMARAYTDNEVLAVSYDIVDENGSLVRRVGRSINDPTAGQLPNLNLDGDANDLGDLINETTADVPSVHFFKLLKPRTPDDPVRDDGSFTSLALTWEYEFRNFYDLRGRDIDPQTFELQIERDDNSLEFPERDPTTGTRWIQVFGLDRRNASGQNQPDEQVDINDTGLFNLSRGILQFPFSRPFDMPDEVVQDFTNGGVDGLDDDLRVPGLYRTVVNTPQERIDLHRFNIVVRQSGVSSNLRLNAFNIREGSEEVILNGRVLTRGTDYDIDYFSGEVNLKGDALAELNAQSNIQVRYEQNPLFGGGRTSLSGLNLGIDFGRRSQLSTTWLYQTRPNAQTKVRLGEEPKRNLVGNLNTKTRIEPEWLRDVADMISRQDVDRTPSFDLNAEVAISVPNPNTRDIAYLEDFEQVDQTVQISLNREGWWWASLPVRGPDLREDPGNEMARQAFGPEDRAYAGWHRPASGGSLVQGQINPTLTELEQNDLLPTLEMIVRADSSTTTDPDEVGGWQEGEYAGIMRSLGEIDLTQAQFLEFWVEAGDAQIFEGRETNPPGFGSALEAFQSSRSGTLHFDFGYINEDFFWGRGQDGSFLLGVEDREDEDNDGVLGIVADDGQTEDRGLDGLLDSEESAELRPVEGRPSQRGDPAGDNFKLGDDDAARAERGEFVFVNGTEGNQRLDTEDIDRDGSFNLEDGFFRVSVDLDDPSNAIVDIYRDFTDNQFQPLPGLTGFIEDALEDRRTWRRYRLDLREAITLIRGQEDEGDTTPYFGRQPDLSRVRTLRIWYEPDAEADEPNTRRFRFADMRFLGNRWIGDQVRGPYGDIVEPAERGQQDFRLGVLNNKDNAGTYVPPIEVVRRNNQDELEQSLQLTYTLDRGFGFRAFREIPGRNGENYLNYDEMNFFWRLPYAPAPDDESVFELDPAQEDLEAFYWVGTDSVNYYEISFPFRDVPRSALIDGDWVEVSVAIEDLTSVKGVPDDARVPLFDPAVVDSTRENPLVKRTVVRDTRTGVPYTVTLRGRPDLQRVKRFYVGLRAPSDASLVSYRGEVLFNELRLRGVNREVGLAQRYSVNAQIPGVADLQVDYQRTDAEFRGLNRDFGSGVNSTRWNARLSSNVRNWIPTFGLDIPISVQRQNSLELPKFEPLSDRELPEAEQDSFRTESTTERFSLQFRKPRPSDNPILQYTLDRFNYTINGTRSETFSPTRETRTKSADQRYSYDLQLRRAPALPIPFTGIELGVLPRQVTVTSNWQFSETRSLQKSLQSDEVIEQTPNIVKRNTNQMQMTLAPLQSLTGSLVLNSGRNQLLDRGFTFLGIDFGAEETFSQNLSLQYKPEFRWLQWARPTIGFNGRYNENRRESIRLNATSREQDEPLLVPEGDGKIGRAGEVRNVSNSADWNVRGDLDLKRLLSTVGGPVKTVGGWLGGLVPTGDDEDQDGGDDRAASPYNVAPNRDRAPDRTDDPAADQGDGQAPPVRPGRPTTASGDTTSTAAAADTTAVAAADTTAVDQPPLLLRLDYLDLFKKIRLPFVSLYENLRPINATWQQQRTSSYNQIGGRADLAYRLGFRDEPDFTAITGVPSTIDSVTVPGQKVLIREDFQSSSRRTNRTVNLSVQSKLSRTINVDASYRRTESERDGPAGTTANSSVEWPSYNIRVQRVHEWGIWDAIGDPFQSSNMDFSYKKTETRPNAPLSSPLPPRISRTISPRWNVGLENGLDANLNVTYGTDESSSLQAKNFSNNLRFNLTVRQNFDATGALSFLRFGQEGTGTTIDMTINANFSTRSSYREIERPNPSVPGETLIERDQEQGRRSFGISPQFSYQFSRNLRASLQFDFSRDTVTQTDISTTRVGLFFEATLNF